MGNQSRDNAGVARVAIFAAAVWIAFALFSAWANGFDFSRFIHIGDKFAAADLPENLDVVRNAGGYDGQFYYRLALDPFTSEREAHGIILDAPALRHQRILYPLTAWVFSLGGRFYVPEALFFVNLACILAICVLGPMLAVAAGREPALGLVFALFPGLVFSLRFDLTEPMAAALMMAYLYLYSRKRPLAANAALALAILARESMIIIALGRTAELLFFSVVRRENRRKELVSSLLPFVPFAALQGWLFLVWGRIPLCSSGSANIVEPMKGFFKYAHWLYFHAVDVKTTAELLEPAGVILFVAAALWAISKDRFKNPAHALWVLAYVFLLFSLNTAWNQTFLRVFTDLFMVSMFLVLNSGSRTMARVVLLMMMLWMMLVVYDTAILDIYFRTNYSGWKY